MCRRRWDSFFVTPDPEPLAPELLDGLEGEQTIATPAGHHQQTFSGQAFLGRGQHGQGNGNRSGRVVVLVFFAGSDVHEDRFLSGEQSTEFFGTDGRFVLDLGEEFVVELFGPIAREFGHPPDRRHKPADGRVAQPVHPAAPVPLVDHERRVLEFLKMLGGGRDTDMEEPGERFDIARGLLEKIEEEETVGMSQGLRDIRKGIPELEGSSR